MWNSFQVSAYEGMIAETVGMPGHDGKPIRAYYSRPLGVDSFPGIVLIPHMPGWDEWCRETARRFTAHGYGVVCPNIYEDFGDGTPVEVSERARSMGGARDKDVMGDVAASLSFLRSQVNASGKVGVIGMCSGGRHTFLAAATLDGIDAAVDCWGGSVICPPERLSPAQPVAPVDYADGIRCPLLPAVLEGLELFLDHGKLGNDNQLCTHPATASSGASNASQSNCLYSIIPCRRRGGSVVPETLRKSL